MTTETAETAEETRDPATLIRRRMEYRPWRVAFWDRVTGVCDWLPQSERYTRVPDVIAALLRDSTAKAPPPRAVMIVGGNESLPPDPETIDSMIPLGWEIPRFTNVSEREDVRRLDIEYHQGPQREGVTISLKTAADWFGPDANVQTCRRTWDRLKLDLRSRFDPYATLISTPGRTGLDLLERSLPFDREYPSIVAQDAELAGLIADNCGQGRLECIGEKREVPRLLALDGRWMYSACLSHLPNGRITHDNLPYVPEHTPGFVIGSYRVPDNWRHIGLLPTFNASTGKREWVNTPGEWRHGFWTTAEVELARKRGWHVDIAERWLWQRHHSDPAAVWRNKLVRLRQDYERAAFRGDVVAGVLQATVRTIMLYAIGKMWAKESYSYGFCGVDALSTLPDNAEYEVRRDIVHYKIPRPLRLERWYRPEWAATVWGRARRRLNTAALELPYEHITNLRNDAVWTDGYDPGWQEMGINGEFRAKEYIPGPLVTAKDETEFRRLLTGAKRLGE